MRSDKARLPFPGGRTLIEHVIAQLEPFFDDILLSVSHASHLDFLPYPRIPDEVPGEGPMRGLHTCLSTARGEIYFVIACDIPEIRIGFVRDLVDASAGYDISVAVRSDGRPEPLFGVYRRSTRAAMNNLLRRKKYSLLDLFPLCSTRFVPLPVGAGLVNLNTREEYHRFLARTNAV